MNLSQQPKKVCVNFQLFILTYLTWFPLVYLFTSKLYYSPRMFDPHSRVIIKSDEILTVPERRKRVKRFKIYILRCAFQFCCVGVHL